MGLPQIKSAHLEIREYTYDGLDSGVNPCSGFEPPGMAASFAPAERAHGLAMQLAPQEWPHWLKQEPPSPCAQYCRPRRGSMPATWSYWQLEPGLWVNQWREPCVDEKLLLHFATLPANVYKVEADKQMIALYGARRATQAC